MCLTSSTAELQHLREVRGDWRAPRCFCVVEDHIYLIEQGDDADDDGRQVFVLTPKGHTLQIYAPKMPADDILHSICHFDGWLIMAAGDGDEQPHLIAAQGL